MSQLSGIGIEAADGGSRSGEASIAPGAAIRNMNPRTIGIIAIVFFRDILPIKPHRCRWRNHKFEGCRADSISASGALRGSG